MDLPDFPTKIHNLLCTCYVLLSFGVHKCHGCSYIKKNYLIPCPIIRKFW